MRHVFPNYTEWKKACEAHGLSMDTFASTDSGPCESDPFDTCWAFHPVPKSEQGTEEFIGCCTMYPDGRYEAMLFDTSGECLHWLNEEDIERHH